MASIFEGQHFFLPPNLPSLVRVNTLIQNCGGSVHLELGSDDMAQPIFVVLKEFSGPDFEKYRESNHFIISIDCIYSCEMQKRPIPEFREDNRILYSCQLEDVVVATSKLDPKERATLQNYIYWLGGRYEQHLTNSVTHLLCAPENYTSEKFQVALSQQQGIIVRPEWLQQCWEHKIRLPAEGFIIPILFNCKISFSGFTTTEKAEFENKVKQSGGEYHSNLTKHCTHLIVKAGNTRKATAAKKWGLFIVSIEWLNHCVQFGGRVNEEYYQIQCEVDESKVTHSDTSRTESDNSRLDSDVYNSEGTFTEPLPRSDDTLSKNTSSWGNPANSSRDSIPDSQPVKSHPKQNTVLFENMIFSTYKLLAHEDHGVRIKVEEYGGIFMASRPNNFSGYIVCAHGSKNKLGSYDPAKITVVSVQWVERCIEDQKLINPSDFVSFQPLPVPMPLSFTNHYVISTSGLRGFERLNIKSLVTILGATFTENFSKSNTHLISNTSEGSKCDGARNWGIPVLSPDWIKRMAITGVLSPVQPYMIPCNTPDNSFGSFSPPPCDQSLVRSPAPLGPSLNIFSGVVAYLSLRMPAHRREQIVQGLIHHGGHFSENLTPKVTHYICDAQDSQRVKTIKVKNPTVLIVHPGWIEDSIVAKQKLGEGGFIPQQKQSLGFIDPPSDKKKTNLPKTPASARKKVDETWDQLKEKHLKRQSRVKEERGRSPLDKSSISPDSSLIILSQIKLEKSPDDMTLSEKMKKKGHRLPPSIALLNEGRTPKKDSDVFLENMVVRRKKAPEESMLEHSSESQEHDTFSTDLGEPPSATDSCGKYDRNRFPSISDDQTSPDNETHRTLSEKSSEKLRNSNEKLRNSNEKLRNSNEKLRNSNETTKNQKKDDSENENMNNLQQVTTSAKQNLNPDEYVVRKKIKTEMGDEDNLPEFSDSPSPLVVKSEVIPEPESLGLVDNFLDLLNKTSDKPVMPPALAPRLESTPLSANSKTLLRQEYDRSPHRTTPTFASPNLPEKYKANNESSPDDYIESSQVVVHYNQNEYERQRQLKERLVVTGKKKEIPQNGCAFDDNSASDHGLPKTPTAVSPSPQQNGRTYHFIFSNFQEAKEKERLVEDIKKLGATVESSSDYTTHCTHLISPKLTASQKCLSACAAGCWLLKPIYIQECIKHGKFLDELAYQWTDKDSSTPITQELARGAKSCRDYIQQNRLKGVFDGWCCVLLPPPSGMKGVSHTTFTSILQAGGATCVEYSKVYSSRNSKLSSQKLRQEGITHIFYAPKTDYKSHMDSEDYSGIRFRDTDMIRKYLLNPANLNN